MEFRHVGLFSCGDHEATTILIPQLDTMKIQSLLLFSLITLLGSAQASFAAEATTVPTWHAQSLAQAVANMLIFAGAGMVAAIVGFKLFDLCTPGNLAKEILENKNTAAAIVSAAVILGVCIIVAAAMFS